MDAAAHIDLTATVFEGVEISLYDLARACMAEGKTSISDRTFRKCLITGPAVVLVLDNVEFKNTNFGSHGSDIRAIVLRPASPNQVVGAIPVTHCTFDGCQFLGLGFTGSDLFLDQLLKLETKA
ncbi:hypothetical protein ASD21_08810 [Caulobacter sp. Root1455]|uniref:hypothetical protein n=1 Tax=unclassified Caulobacter TaxID=2648921 RepID=UPI0006FDBE22|nr:MULTISPECIES: hypothetical protein [unclassified Caulobacter]KQY31140.1 hypothetical protein ASD38_07285 [Caulobacter sp. Root487D2Y]KQY95433.1 hypothetical protein ASD21_08810 [Caulobacter sp. Root1455]